MIDHLYTRNDGRGHFEFLNVPAGDPTYRRGERISASVALSV